MKIRVLFLFLLTSLSQRSFAEPDTVRIGAYVMSIHDINFRDKEYTMRYWLWMLHNMDELDAVKQTEIPNAKSVERSEVFEDSLDNKAWVIMKMKSVMKQSWKVNDYPFDKQFLSVHFENTEYDQDDLVFVADTLGSTYDKELTVDGWSVTNFNVTTGTNNYETNFGDYTNSNASCTYATFNINMKLERNAFGLFLKLFVGMYISFLIAMVSFLIHPKDVEPRFGLPVGALFAAVGNKYIIDSLLPETASFTLVDSLHTFTFVSIFLTIFVSAFALSAFRKKQVKKYRKINRVGGLCVLITFIVLNLLIIGLAIFA